MSTSGIFLRLLFACVLFSVTAYGSYAIHKNSDFISSEHCHRFPVSIVAVVIASGLLGFNVLMSTFCLGSCCSYISSISLLLIYLVTDTYFITTFIRMDDCCKDLFKTKMTDFYRFTILNIIASGIFLLALFVILIIKCSRRSKVSSYSTSSNSESSLLRLA